MNQKTRIPRGVLGVTSFGFEAAVDVLGGSRRGRSVRNATQAGGGR